MDDITTYQDRAAGWIGRAADAMTKAERRIIDSAHRRRIVSRDVSLDYASEGGTGARLADSITHWAGSWTFILLFLAFLAVWAVINTVLLRAGAFDPYPYVFLNLVLSMLAAIQAPVILMAQNRQAERDRIDAKHDYEVNLKAELEIMSLHEKIDALRKEEVRLLREELGRASAELHDLRAALSTSRAGPDA